MQISIEKPLFLQSQKVIFGGRDTKIDLSGTIIDLTGTIIDLSGSSIGKSLNELKLEFTTSLSSLGNLSSTVTSLNSLTRNVDLSLYQFNAISKNIELFIDGTNSDSFVGWDISGIGLALGTQITGMSRDVIANDDATGNGNKHILIVTFSTNFPAIPPASGTYKLSLGIVKRIDLLHNSVTELYDYFFKRT